MLHALGVRLRASGSVCAGPTLVVANHVSWLDVIALAAVVPAEFVCKVEVAGWPVIGWLVRRAGAILIDRNRFRDIRRVNDILGQRLAAGQAVAAFPEGTTTEGSGVLVFRAGLFQPAVERGMPVHPVAIAYSCDAAAFIGDMTFVESLLAIAGTPRLDVALALLGPIKHANITHREAAVISRMRILRALPAIRASLRCGTAAGVFAAADDALLGIPIGSRDGADGAWGP